MQRRLALAAAVSAGIFSACSTAPEPPAVFTVDGVVSFSAEFTGAGSLCTVSLLANAEGDVQLHQQIYPTESPGANETDSVSTSVHLKNGKLSVLTLDWSAGHVGPVDRRAVEGPADPAPGLHGVLRDWAGELTGRVAGQRPDEVERNDDGPGAKSNTFVYADAPSTATAELEALLGRICPTAASTDLAGGGIAVIAVADRVEAILNHGEGPGFMMGFVAGASQLDRDPDLGGAGPGDPALVDAWAAILGG